MRSATTYNLSYMAGRVFANPLFLNDDECKERAQEINIVHGIVNRSPSLLNHVPEFIQGVMHEIGNVTTDCRVPFCTIQTNADKVEVISQLIDAPHDKENDGEYSKITMRGTNCMDFLGQNNIAFDKSHYIQCNVELLCDDAVMPSKAHESDVGFDLTLISECKRFNDNLIMYDTGVKISPAYGFYTEVVPRSSLGKSGWLMANSVGIIDASYTGTLKVMLVRVTPNAPEPEMPFRACQLIMREQIHAELKLAKVGVTVRGAGGFGSSG